MMAKYPFYELLYEPIASNVEEKILRFVKGYLWYKINYISREINYLS